MSSCAVLAQLPSLRLKRQKARAVARHRRGSVVLASMFLMLCVSADAGS